MAISITVNDVIELRVVCQGGDQIGINVSHWQCANPVGAVTLEGIAQWASNEFASAYKNLLSASSTYRGVGARRLTPNPTLEVAYSGDNGAGVVAGDTLPRQVSGVITKKTASPGQAGRGRVYVPFPGGDDNSILGDPTAGYLGSLATLAAIYASPMLLDFGGGITVDLLPKLLRKPALSHKPIIGSVARTIWGTQRRRGDYGRTNLLPF